MEVSVGHPSIMLHLHLMYLLLLYMMLLFAGSLNYRLFQNTPALFGLKFAFLENYPCSAIWLATSYSTYVSPINSPIIRASSRIKSHLICSYIYRSGSIRRSKLPLPLAYSRHSGHVGSLCFQSSMQSWQ